MEKMRQKTKYVHHLNSFSIMLNFGFQSLRDKPGSLLRGSKILFSIDFANGGCRVVYKESPPAFEPEKLKMNAC